MYCNRDGSVGPRFYSKGSTGGLEQVKDRKSGSVVKLTKNKEHAVMEIRIPWNDLGVKPTVNDEFSLNIAAYAKPDSQTPSSVSSLWVVDTPSWHPDYWGLLRLGRVDRRVP
jgi:hypothetical protein